MSWFSKPRGEQGDMVDITECGRTAPDDNSLRTVTVLIGLALFVSGFLLLVSAMSEAQSDSTGVAAERSVLGEEPSRERGSLTNLIALSMSIAGLAVATVGPVIWFVRWSKRPQ